MGIGCSRASSERCCDLDAYVEVSGIGVVGGSDNVLTADWANLTTGLEPSGGGWAKARALDGVRQSSP